MTTIYKCAFMEGDSMTLQNPATMTNNLALLRVYEKAWEDPEYSSNLQDDLLEDGAQIGLTLSDIRDLHDKLGKLIKDMEIGALLE